MESREKQRYDIAVEAALQLFGNEIDAIGWLNEPSIPLGNVSPRSLLTTDDGLSMVLYEIDQMRYGHPT